MRFTSRPAISNVSKAGIEDQVLSFAASDFASQVTDIDGDSLASIQVTSLPGNGTLRLAGATVAFNEVIAAGDIVGVGLDRTGASIRNVRVDGTLSAEVYGAADLSAVRLPTGANGGGVRTDANLKVLHCQGAFTSSTLGVTGDAKIVRVLGLTDTSTLTVGGDVSGLFLRGGNGQPAPRGRPRRRRRAQSGRQHLRKTDRVSVGNTGAGPRPILRPRDRHRPGFSEWSSCPHRREGSSSAQSR